MNQVDTNSAAANRSACTNCGSTLTAEYCAHCGQSQQDARVSVVTWLREFLSEQFSLTARLPRTLFALLFRPGFLSLEWQQGRRARYIDPTRLYLLALLVALTVSTFIRLASPQLVREATDLGMPLGRLTPANAAVRDAIRSVLLFATVVTIPLLALTIKLALLPRRTWFVDHLVFSMHYHALVFLIGALAWPIERAWTAVGITLGALWCVPYLILALRNTYALAGNAGGLRILGVLLVALIAAIQLSRRAAAVIAERVYLEDTRVVTERQSDRIAMRAETGFWQVLDSIGQADSVSNYERALDVIDLHQQVDFRHRDLAHAYRLATLLELTGQHRQALRIAREWTDRTAMRPPLKQLMLGTAFRAAYVLGDSSSTTYAQRMIDFKPNSVPALDARLIPELNNALAEARAHVARATKPR